MDGASGCLDPAERFHCHTFWHLIADACRSGEADEATIWHLWQADAPRMPPDAHLNVRKVELDLTFQVVTEEMLDEFALARRSGIIPERFQKDYASIEIHCSP